MKGNTAWWFFGGLAMAILEQYGLEWHLQTDLSSGKMCY